MTILATLCITEKLEMYSSVFAYLVTVFRNERNVIKYEEYGQIHKF